MTNLKKNSSNEWFALHLVSFFTIAFSAVGLMIIASHAAWAESESKRTVTTQEIKKYAENYLVSHLDWKPESMDIEVSYDGKDLILPAGNMTLDFGTLNNSRRVGRIPLIAQVKVDDKFIKRLRMNAKVAVFQDVVRITNSIQRNNIISQSDVVVERVRTERLLKDIPTRLNKVIGQKATQNLQKGKIVKFRDLKRVPMVERGSRVVILATKGS